MGISVRLLQERRGAGTGWRIPDLKNPQDRLLILDRVGQGAWRALAAVGLFLVALWTGLLLYGLNHSDTIYEGVSVAEVKLGGMTEAEAQAALDRQFSTYAVQPIEIRAGDQVLTLTPKQVGAQIDSETTAQAAMQYGRQGSLWARSARWVAGFLHGAEIQPRIVVDTERLDAEIAKFAQGVVRPAADARVVMTAERPTVQPEVPGVAVDLAGSRARVLAEMNQLDSQPVELVTTPIAPAVTAAMLSAGIGGATTAVSQDLKISASEGTWWISVANRQQLVAINPDGSVAIDERPIRELVEGIAGGLDHPGVDADILVDETGKIAVQPMVISAELDVDQSVAAIVDGLRNGVPEVNLVINRVEPAITDIEANAALPVAQALVDPGFTVTWKEGDIELGSADLIQALVIARDPAASEPFSFSLDPDTLVGILTPFAEAIDVEARDARFRVIDGKVTIVDREATGRKVDLNRTVESLLTTLERGERSSRLSVESLKPKYRVADAKKIKIPTDLYGDAATWYGQSSEPRKQNVERVVELETGWLIPPGGIFSYAEFSGLITEENGFVTGLGIVADGETGGVTTAPVVGGGICQVSTTIFQAAFWAGMPIVERYAHPYWLTTYGVAPRGMKGLDAMVNIEPDWALDMKFQNATDGWLLVVVIADGENVTAQVFVDNPGWTVEVEGPTISNVVAPDPKMIFTDSTELPGGQEMVVESAQEGFDATIRRVVKDHDGNVIDDLYLTSTYAASRNRTLRGTA